MGEGINNPNAVAAVNGRHCSWTPYPDGTGDRVPAGAVMGSTARGTSGKKVTSISRLRARNRSRIVTEPVGAVKRPGDVPAGRTRA
jgi:hypothetical protein